MKSWVLGMFVLFLGGYGMSASAGGNPGKMIRAKSTDASVFAWARVYCTPDHESHIATESVTLTKTEFAPPASPLYIGGGGAVTTTFFGGFEPNWGVGDLEENITHPAPAVQWLTILTGTVFLKTTDGESRVFRAGDVMHLEDIAPCKGHISHNVSREAAFVQFAR